MHKQLDVIEPQEAQTLAGLFRCRVQRTPNSVAYHFYDEQSKRWKNISWAQAANTVARYQMALARESLAAGDRVAIMMRNCPEWVMFEQACNGLGLITVPLYTNDRTENIAYVLQDAGVKVLLIEGAEQLEQLSDIDSQIDGLVRVLSLKTCKQYNRFSRLQTLDEWTADIGELSSADLQARDNKADDLVTIVYTSGTTGRSKGVMLSNTNILFNAYAGIGGVPVYPDDVFLSFLPLSHMLERTVGYYIPMMTGATMAFARSVQDLAEDLLSVRPTILISVPRIYERVYNKIQDQLSKKSPFAQKLFTKAVDAGWQRFEGRGSPLSWPLLKALVAKKVLAKLGGRLRIAICGGAPLSTPVAKTFIGLGLNLLQGYGLTETSPIISVNRSDNNDPVSVGPTLPGIEIKIGDNNELLTKSPSIMLGYWNNPTATAEMIDSDGWLHTGDQARIDNNRIYITGRLKEILVLSNGEKVPPSDMEMAIAMDPLIEQVMVIGEGRPYLSALAVLEPNHWKALAEELGLDCDDMQALQNEAVCKSLLQHITTRIKNFPGYAQVQRVAACHDPWTVENGLITPTLKLKRQRIMEHYKQQVDSLYAGHQ